MRIYNVVTVDADEEWDIHVKTFTDYAEAYKHFSTAMNEWGGEIDEIDEGDLKSDVASYCLYNKAVILRGQEL
jgi:vacuolar-type H+-ATPase subunit B/Vma2